MLHRALLQRYETQTKLLLVWRLWHITTIIRIYWLSISLQCQQTHKDTDIIKYPNKHFVVSQYKWKKGKICSSLHMHTRSQQTFSKQLHSTQKMKARRTIKNAMSYCFILPHYGLTILWFSAAQSQTPQQRNASIRMRYKKYLNTNKYKAQRVLPAKMSFGLKFFPNENSC